jgi:hypothetical protein
VHLARVRQTLGRAARSRRRRRRRRQTRRGRGPGVNDTISNASDSTYVV